MAFAWNSTQGKFVIGFIVSNIEGSKTTYLILYIHDQNWSKLITLTANHLWERTLVRRG